MSKEVLDILARRTPNGRPANVEDSEFYKSAYLEASADAQRQRDVLSQLRVDFTRERSESAQRLSAVESQLHAAQSACTAAEAKCQVLESRPPETRVERDDTAIDALRSENVDLRVECATYKTRCVEAERLTGVYKELAAGSAARVSTLEARPAVVSEPETEPSEYDIDVVRGADDRIRSLKVRCTD